jgi:hypothetical protein
MMRSGSTTVGDSERRLIRCANLKLAALGAPTVGTENDPEFGDTVSTLLAHQQETERLLSEYLCPADQRIQTFLDAYLAGTGISARLPRGTLVSDRPGMARILSLPPGKNSFVSDLVSSYRVSRGVLHNPIRDRRTTQGVFHIAEGGFPVSDDKLETPKACFGRLLARAFAPPRSLLALPFTSAQEDQAALFVSLLLRPVVCPKVPGFIEEKSMEIRFFAPGSLVSNLDFLESIFGNGGDPYLPENDAGLDLDHWTGHSGCVVLAPHIVGLPKKELGLPPWDLATERQRRDGMCWKTEDELYNEGRAFKLVCRSSGGVIVSVIADNYYGYCKKEVKSHISFSANLFGLCEEEHAGGALVFPSYDLGEEFWGDKHVPRLGHTFAGVAACFGGIMDLQPEGYGIDKNYPDILYVPENVRFDLHRQKITWESPEGERSLPLLPDKTYVRPSGYKVHMEKPPGDRAWRLIGTVSEGTLCHKPCTVSGGGKSEISKPVTDAILQGPVFVADFPREFEMVSKMIRRDYSDRFAEEGRRKSDSRPVLSAERSLGSVIKLLTPSSQYTREYNDWLRSIPQYIKELLFVVKRFNKPEWAGDWRSHFSVNSVNGTPGNELKCDNRRLVSNYLRVGFEQDGSWRTFGLRKDFHPAVKVQTEDDITASVVVPASRLDPLNPACKNRSVKFVFNCEKLLFQRPDEAVHPGYDRQAEQDFSRPGNFFSNYEPLGPAQARAMVEDSIGFVKFTAPARALIQEAAEAGPASYFVCSAKPRLVGPSPSKNPRYLQSRFDLDNPRDCYLAEIATRLQRRVPLGQPVRYPVNAVIAGRRNTPPDPVSRIRSLAVYNPIHYMELPELFIEFISSMTGKSPSTTGAGSEGALTKGPFNAMPLIVDLNNALVSWILTGHDGFISSAGHIGPKYRVDHDISLLIPEIWCRMSPQERDPAWLIEHGCLEKCADFHHSGPPVLASRLGYRITTRFVIAFFGRVFNHPDTVLTPEMLRPESQDWEVFEDGMDNIVTTHRLVAEGYFRDGTISLACPPLKALLHIMAENQWEGRGLDHPELRGLFTRESMLASEWYQRRLSAKQALDVKLTGRGLARLEDFLGQSKNVEVGGRLGLPARLEQARLRLAAQQAPAYLESLLGTLGLDPACFPA